MESYPLDDASIMLKYEVSTNALQREEHVEALRDLEPSNV
jgi:hypothetical protein